MEMNKTFAAPDNATITLGAYSVAFTRPFSTPNATEDFQLSRNLIDVTWVYGRIENSTFMMSFNETHFGTGSFDLRVPVEPKPVNPVQSGAVSTFSQGIAAVIVLALVLLVQ